MGITYSNQGEDDVFEKHEDERPVVIDSKREQEEKENNNRIKLKSKSLLKHYINSYSQTETILKAKVPTINDAHTQTKSICSILSSYTQTEIICSVLTLF